MAHKVIFFAVAQYHVLKDYTINLAICGEKIKAVERIQEIHCSDFNSAPQERDLTNPKE